MMLGFNVNVRVDTKELTRNLTRLAEQQIPFATATALNSTAMIVRDVERKNLKDKFPTATPFTINSVVVIRARKNNLTAMVIIRPIAAKYLQPYEDGGRHVLNSKALLNPKGVNLNQYGNLAKGKLAALRGRSDVFIGEVQGKSGPIRGVWQRVKASKGKPASLKLLIRFGDALPVKERLEYGTKGIAVVRSVYGAEFNKAMALALATAK